MKLSLDLPGNTRRLTSLATRFRQSTNRRFVEPALYPAIDGAMAGTVERTVESYPSWYVEARDHIRRHAWGHAQRALEKAPPGDTDPPAALDLVSIRRIRRAIRRTSRWPSDVDAHIDLGQAYFDLDLAEEALAEFNLVQHLAPDRHEGYVLAALEYVYRGQYAQAAGVWYQARAANPELPELEQFLGSLPAK